MAEGKVATDASVRLAELRECVRSLEERVESLGRHL
jgi:hypothetical protein